MPDSDIILSTDTIPGNFFTESEDLYISLLIEDDRADDPFYTPPKETNPQNEPGEPHEPPEPGEEPTGEEPPKPPQRPPMEPGGGTSDRPPPGPKGEAIVTYERGRPPDYVVEKLPDTIGDKDIIRLTPYDQFMKENNVVATAGVIEGDDGSPDEG